MINKLTEIRERNVKLYIVADETQHKVLKPLKEDIAYLLDLLDKFVDEYYKEHREK